MAGNQSGRCALPAHPASSTALNLKVERDSVGSGTWLDAIDVVNEVALVDQVKTLEKDVVVEANWLQGSTREDGYIVKLEEVVLATGNRRKRQREIFLRLLRMARLSLWERSTWWSCWSCWS